MIVNQVDARVFAKKIFWYWLNKIEFVEPENTSTIQSGLVSVDSLDENAVPEVICESFFRIFLFAIYHELCHL